MSSKAGIMSESLEKTKGTAKDGVKKHVSILDNPEGVTTKKTSNPPSKQLEKQMGPKETYAATAISSTVDTASKVNEASEDEKSKGQKKKDRKEVRKFGLLFASLIFHMLLLGSSIFLKGN